MKFDRIVSLFEVTVITLGFAVATLLLFANVVARYVFDSGFTWVLETVQYLFAWVVLVGAAHGVKAGIHLGIDILTEKFSLAVQRYLALLAVTVCLLFSVTVFILSIQYTYRIQQWGDLSLDLQIPQWIPYLAIPVGLSLMSFRLLQVAMEIWRGDRVHIGRAEHDISNQVKIEE